MKLANPETFVRFVKAKLAGGPRSIWSLAHELSEGYGDSVALWESWLRSELSGETWLVKYERWPDFVALKD